MEARRTIAHEVYARLRRDIIRLAIEPGETLSEAEVARACRVSRQPVREAFIKLAEDGFLLIRPQRPTVVKPIAEAAVLNAQFIRLAIESAIVADAARSWTGAGERALAALLADQEAASAAGDRERFHDLDEAFHREIAERAGRLAAWEAIDRHKAQMDRVRFLSLAFGTPPTIAQHRRIAAALAAHDERAAVAAIRDHLSKIKGDLAPLRARHGAFFAPQDAPADA
jgi:DNA-binding GntR family transcriptional regulator